MPRNLPKIKPCPFCGAMPRKASRFWPRSKSEFHVVICPNLKCPSFIDSKSELGAIMRWNERYGDRLIEKCAKQIIAGNKSNADAINKIRPFIKGK